jgi:hypothetical protein
MADCQPHSHSVQPRGKFELRIVPFDVPESLEKGFLDQVLDILIGGYPVPEKVE